jgi:hypothetical protein
MTDSPITVDCQITSQKYDFDYDLDNTLEVFMNDLQDQDPPMAMGRINWYTEPFPSVRIDDNEFHIVDHLQNPLYELGVIPHSCIVILWKGINEMVSEFQE